MTMLQSRVKNVGEKYKFDHSSKLYGTKYANCSKKEEIDEIVQNMSLENFYYLDESDLEGLDLSTINKDNHSGYLVNYSTSEVISLEGIKYNGETYYVLSEIIANTDLLKYGNIEIGDNDDWEEFEEIIDTPIIEIASGTLNSGYSYYSGEVSVKITYGVNVTSGTYKINNSNETNITSGDTFTIAEHGIHAIDAYTYGSTGTRKEANKTIAVCINHDYESVAVVDSTCSSSGSTMNVCKNCGFIDESSIDMSGHIIPDDWKTDSTYHWKECEKGCGTIVVAKTIHSGGTATCIAKAICSTCGESYGDLNSSNHAGAKVTGTCTYYKWSCCGLSGGSSTHNYQNTSTTKVCQTCKNCGSTTSHASGKKVYFSNNATYCYSYKCPTCGLDGREKTGYWARKKHTLSGWKKLDNTYHYKYCTVSACKYNSNGATNTSSTYKAKHSFTSSIHYVASASSTSATVTCTGCSSYSTTHSVSQVASTGCYCKNCGKNVSAALK